MKILIDGQTLSTPEIYRGIGQVFLKILNNLIPLAKDHTIFLCVYEDYDKTALRGIKNNITILSLGKEIDASESGNKSYTDSISQFILRNEIDCFWIPNPVMLNVNFLNKPPMCRVVITFHDLIPYIFQKEYLNSWSTVEREEYQKRLRSLDLIANCIITVSDSTRNDLGNYLKIDREKIRTIYHGSDRKLEKPITLTGLIPRQEKYLLYVGGFDPRKNMERSVIAFKKLIEKYHHPDLVFFIICDYDDSAKKQFTNYIQTIGLSGKVHLTGFVSDSDLYHYYKNADLLFFPSLYEGFGLPVIEAMSAGIPVAVSDRSSLPELVGDAGLLFDPENTDYMAEQLHRILSEPDLKEKMVSRGLQISQKFTWKAGAEQYLEVFEVQYTSGSTLEKPPAMEKPQVKIAYFSPVPPQISGISQYSKELLLELKNHADVDLFLDKGIIPEDPEIREKFRYFYYQDFPTLIKSEGYDGILYHIGNNTLHEYIYRTSLQYPGIMVLHDYVIHPFIRCITLDRGHILQYFTEIFSMDNPGRTAIIRQMVKKGLYSIDVIGYPLNERLIKRNKITVTHSHYVKKMLNNNPNVRVIPQGCYSIDYTEEEKNQSRFLLKLDKTEILIAVFGFMNRNKRPELVARVINRLVDQNFPVKLLFVGNADNDLKKDINAISENIQFTGYVTDDDYHRFLLVSDIVINLRFPTMGETSKTLLDAMGYGKPVIVSNIGSYRETPNNCCWKVDVDENEEELLYQYLLALVKNQELRQIMGKNAKEFIKKHNNWKDIALQYIGLINSIKKSGIK